MKFTQYFNVTGSWGEALRQIGNAVPVKLAETVGRHLHDLLKNDPAVKLNEGGGVIYSYPEAVEGEQMMLAMERPVKYDVGSRRQKRHQMFA